MIRNIIFDLGNVLVNVEYKKFREKIYAHNISKEKYNDFFQGADYRILGYEAGDITSEEFISKCIKELELKMDPEEFSHAFNNMFSEITEMSAFLHRLSEEGEFNLFLLSNTSPLHFEFIRGKYNFMALLHKCAVSYELKSLKPHKDIYERAIEHLGIKPEESVFIDDLKENCEAAEQVGIKSIHYNKNNHKDFEIKFEQLLSNN